ncbi:hypothetical protein QBC46DRAFT_348425 [Diplogelasinospora grovesii]|uniref:Uncharacterized protein n=1 Tax=Diplogelasinospora grovesii TaxID=303347 RepID=A0AAN6RYX9_9PEZI|nr:hypothetical protein QBC46DRAFT_348425 [Diplogelasinospora grovesii]
MFVFEGLLIKQIPHVVQRVMHQDLVVSFMTLVSQPFEVLYFTKVGQGTGGGGEGLGGGGGGGGEAFTGTDKQGRLWRPAFEYHIIYCRAVMKAFADTPLGRILREELNTGDEGDMLQVTFDHEWIDDLWFFPQTDDMGRFLDDERQGVAREGRICGVWEVDGEFDSVYDYGYDQGEGRGWRHEIRNCKEQQRWFLSWFRKMLRRGVQAVIDARPDLGVHPDFECEYYHDDDDEDGYEGADEREEEREGKGGEGSGGSGSGGSGSGGSGSGSSDTPLAGQITLKNIPEKTGNVKNESAAQEEDAERRRQFEQEEKSLVDGALARLMEVGWAVLADTSYQREKSSSSSDTPVAGSIAPKASRVASVPESGEPSPEVKEGNAGQKENAAQEEDAETRKQLEEEEKSLVAKALVDLMKVGWACLAGTPDAVDLD